MVATLRERVKYYTDRPYMLTRVPFNYLGMKMIKTPNHDRNMNAAGDYLTFKIIESGKVFVAFDSRARSLPDWLWGFGYTGDKIYTSLRPQPHLKIYSKMYSAGDCVNFGSNKAPGFYGDTASNYIVFFGKSYPCKVFLPGPDWCRNCGPCSEGQGDCDGDAECKEGLICVRDIGAKYGWFEFRDVCEKPCGPCDVFRPGPDWCHDCGPCSEGQGDCDNNAECEKGLICVHNVGAEYGWPESRDVCEKPD